MRKVQKIPNGANGSRRGIVVGVRFQPEDLERLDAFATREGLNRSEALRRLVEGGLRRL